MIYERLIELLNYDSCTGEFYWIAKRRGASKSKPAGTITKNGYRQIMIDNKSYLAHRLAWLYIYKQLPTLQLDHVNGNKLDNSIKNLREVTALENMQNFVKANKNNKANLLGAFYCTKNGKWFSRISVNNKKKWLGTFDSPVAAHKAYIKAKRQIHLASTI